MAEKEKRKYNYTMKPGRPTKYDPVYCDQIIAFFTRPPFHMEYKREYFKDGTLKAEVPILFANEFPTFQGFAAEIGVTMQTLHEWQGVHTEFSDAYARAKSLQERIWLINSMQNLYNSQFAQFFGKNCLGYKDKQEVDLQADVMAIPADVAASRIAELLSKADVKQLKGYGVNSDD